jgi:hypothetical protein
MLPIEGVNKREYYREVGLTTERRESLFEQELGSNWN